MEVTRVRKSGVDCCDFAVLLDEEHEIMITIWNICTGIRANIITRRNPGMITGITTKKTMDMITGITTKKTMDMITNIT